MPVVSIGVLAGVSSSKKIAPEASLGEKPKEGTALDHDQVKSEPSAENSEPSQHSTIKAGGAAQELAEGGKRGSADKVLVQPWQGGWGDSAIEGVVPDSIESPGSSSRDSSEGGPKGCGPATGVFHYTVVSSSESSTSSDTVPKNWEKADYTHQLNVAVTPDGKVITGRCLTYEDRRGGTLAKDFFCDKIHYSSANPSYHKRDSRGLKSCGNGCTVA